jgi:hypothetical protein
MCSFNANIEVLSASGGPLVCSLKWKLGVLEITFAAGRLYGPNRICFRVASGRSLGVASRTLTGLMLGATLSSISKALFAFGHAGGSPRGLMDPAEQDAAETTDQTM